MYNPKENIKQIKDTQHKISRYHSSVYQMNSIKLVYDLKKEAIQDLIVNIEKILNSESVVGIDEIVKVTSVSTDVHENKDYGYGATAASYINLTLSNDTEMWLQVSIDDGYDDIYNEFQILDEGEFSETVIEKVNELTDIHNFYSIYNDIQTTLWDYSEYNPELVITNSKDIETVALIEKEISSILTSMNR